LKRPKSRSALHPHQRGTASLVLQLALLIGSVSRAAGFPTVQPERPHEQLGRQAVTVAVQDPQGLALGSGILLLSGQGGDWVVTNRHVLQTQPVVCVITADQRAQPGRVHPGPEDWADLDLALIWLPKTAVQPPRPVANVVALASVEPFSLVVATGYPVEGKPSTARLPYQEVPGLLVPLLEVPLKEGFDLTYTATVQKGMSGGGVFVGDKLIGLNGAHPDPLWQGEWQRPNRTAVGERLNRQLELVALGLSSRHLLPLLDPAQTPTPPAAMQAAPPTCQPSAEPSTHSF
jgi:hypothetical protein